MAEEKKVTRKKIMAHNNSREYMTNHYQELDRAVKTGEKKVAWCTSVGPAEILRSMGFLVFFPETHSAALGTTRMATDLIPHANALGYSPDICSYLTADIGAYLKGVTPIQAMGIETVPKPDVLVFNTNQCRDVQDWFAWFAREFNAPLIGINTPRAIKDVEANHISTVAKQMENLIQPLEKISGKSFSLDKLKHVVTLSRKCSDIWKEVLDTAENIPSPLTFFDGTTLMGPAVVGRGTQEALDFYEILLAELKERIKNNEGAVEGEHFRLYWDGIPVWGRLRAHSELFSSLRTCIVASTYCNSWIFTAFDPEDPFNSMARAYTELFSVRTDDVKEKYIKDMMAFFKVDGIIFHDSKTCPTNSNNRYGMPKRLEKETSIPSLIINGDLNDLRLISDEQTKTNVEAFIEQLEERK